jgi:1,4-alpha-glucan branching enzyme
MFDMEHFGHWWFEGAIWLEHVIRKFASGSSSVRMLTANEYLSICEEGEVVDPSTSSWGYQGYSETWLMGNNHWVYPAVFKTIERFRRLARRGHNGSGKQHAAMNQYLRELLLAQASDWAFILHADTASMYATQRVEEHLSNMHRIHAGLDSRRLNAEWLMELQQKNNIFAGVDLLERYGRIG